jgi:hypothetical protein
MDKLHLLKKLEQLLWNRLLPILLLLTTFAVANPGKSQTAEEKKLYHLKKAKYHEIQAKLQAGDITLRQAQQLWQKELKKLKKREGK